MPFNKRIPVAVEHESQHRSGNRSRCHYEELLLLLQQFICKIISQRHTRKTFDIAWSFNVFIEYSRKHMQRKWVEDETIWVDAPNFFH